MLAELTLIVGLATAHTHSNEYYNNDNQLVMVQYENWTVGTMMNSYNNRSFMAGYDFNFEFGGSRWGLLAGGTTGYDVDLRGEDEKLGKWQIDKASELPVMPMIAPYLRTPVTDNFSIQINSLGSAFNISGVITF